METHSKYFFADRPTKALPDELRPILIADSFSTPSNVGSIIRLAANVGAWRVVVINGEHLRESKIKKTAGAAWDQIDVVFTDSEGSGRYLPDGYALVALETSGEARSIYDGSLPGKMALVLGNEKYGMSKQLLEQCDELRFIPMPGKIKSMNVSHAASVCLFEWYRQNI